ncbi:DNA-protecting protein DprA [Sesbania bispinosa]|nr:DNA-protecting protein DprA [Sesbania bispinosa]
MTSTSLASCPLPPHPHDIHLLHPTSSSTPPRLLPRTLTTTPKRVVLYSLGEDETMHGGCRSGEAWAIEGYMVGLKGCRGLAMGDVVVWWQRVNKCGGGPAVFSVV